MRRPICVIVALTTVGLTTPPASAQGPRNPSMAGWGDAVDPDRDCKIGLDGRRLTIEVPGTKHDLSAETDEMNAPRVLRAIDGDFIAQVKVAGNVRHSGKRTSERSVAYHGAGLLLWKDARTYVRLERAAIVREGGEIVHYAHLELRRDGEPIPGGSVRIADQDTYLRLERRGDRIYGLASVDGYRWACFEPLAVSLPKDLKLGFAAVSTSTDPLKVTFSDLETYRRQAGPATP